MTDTDDAFSAIETTSGAEAMVTLDDPILIVTHYYETLADAVEAVEAAEKLGLGVNLRNRTIAAVEPGDAAAVAAGEWPEPAEASVVYSEEWVVELYDDLPLEDDEDPEWQDLDDEDVEIDDEVAADLLGRFADGGPEEPQSS